jgi:rRNA maturation endonuclease Nob1
MEAEANSRKLEAAAERRREATNESLKQEESRRRTVAEIKEQAKREFMDEVEGEVSAWKCHVEDSDEDEVKVIDNKNGRIGSGRMLSKCSIEFLPLAFILVPSTQ